MSDSEDQRFAPPQAQVADMASDEIVLAGRGVRLLATIIDGVIAAGVVLVLSLIPAIKSLVDGAAMSSASPLKAWNFSTPILGGLVFIVIQGWPLLTRGQTLGKMLFKLRIIRSDGSKPDAWRLLGLRYGVGFLLNVNTVLSMVYGLIDSLLIFRASRKCLHDTIADTQVIKL